MRAMKDSGIEWIGEIPQEWHVDRLKYCADLDSEKLSEKTDPEYTFNYIDISSVTEYGGIGNTQEMTFEKSPSRARMVVHDGDTIISTVRTYLKAIAYIDGLEDHICSTGFCVVTPNEKLHPKFGYFLLQSDYFVKKIVSESVGVSYPAISSTEIGNMSIAIPVPEEQARIACYLDAKCAEIDALIAAKEKTNALLKERRQSIIYEAITKGLNPDVPMKDSGIEWIGQIPEHWGMMRAKYFAEITNGSDPKTEGDIPVYGSGSESFRTCGEFKEGPVVLLGRKGATLHIPHYVDGKYWNVDTAFDVRTNEKVCLLKFYYYASICFDYKLYISTTTLPSMTQYNYGNMFIPIPSVEEQAEILKHIERKLSELDHVIASAEDNIQKLKEYRQSVIYEAVTGKIEV